MSEQLIEKSRLYYLLLHPDKPLVLMETVGECWSLPVASLSERCWPGAAEKAQPPMRALFGLAHPWPIVRCLAQWDNIEPPSLCFQIDCLDPSWTPPTSNMQWVPLEELAQHPLAFPQIQEAIEQCISGTIPTERPAWERPGWFARAYTWIHEQLLQQGYDVESIEQIKHWCLSSVMRIRTTTETLYFKASLLSSFDSARPLLFANEATLLKTLADLVPEHTPNLIAVHELEGWMILQEFGPDLCRQANTENLIAAAEIMYRVQQITSQQKELFLQAGCKDRSLDTLIDDFGVLLDDDEALADLREEERVHLQGCAPIVQALATRLASYAIPPALVHGDLHLANIALQHGRMIFFDWTDGCIAHPFFDALTITDNPYFQTESQEASEHLRSVYLAGWSIYGSQELLAEALAIAYILTAVHQAISYQRIFANVEACWQHEFREGTAHWIRVLFDQLKQWQDQHTL